MNKRTRLFAIRLAGTSIVAVVCLFAGIIIGKGSAANDMAENNRIWQQNVDKVRVESTQANTALQANINNLQKEVHDLEIKNNALQSQVDYFSAGYIEDHSDWMDCHHALSFINAQLADIDKIDTQAPVPVIYMKDGRTMSANTNHEIVEIVTAPEAPTVPIVPPVPHSTEPSFTPDNSMVVSLANTSE